MKISQKILVFSIALIFCFSHNSHTEVWIKTNTASYEITDRCSFMGACLFYAVDYFNRVYYRQHRIVAKREKK